MKIMELSVKDIRGIREKITLKPNGENFVVFGSNGTGKSAIVDALDFLFTGNISRLTGRGTQGMSLKDHGPHIDARAEDATVSATIMIEGVPEPIKLSRRFSMPSKLDYTGPIDNELAKDALATALKGQHVLSRAEILKYVAAEASKRSEEILAILDIRNIEEIRKAFVTIKGDADRTLSNCKANYETSVQTISHLLGAQTISDEEILTKTNECRALLKGEAVTNLTPGKLKEGVALKLDDNKKRINPQKVKQIIAAIRNRIESEGKAIWKKEQNLRAIVKQCKIDGAIRKDLASKRLLDLGISLIDDSGACPLCLKDWSPGELKKFLITRASRAKQATELYDRMSALSAEIIATVSKHNATVLTLVEETTIAKKSELTAMLNKWAEELEQWIKCLTKATEDYDIEEPDHRFSTFFAPEQWKKSIADIEKLAECEVEMSPEQNAWDMLTALDTVLTRYLDEKKKYSSQRLFAEKATTLLNTFTETKDTILEELYNSVSSDFTTYYKFLHGNDENDFQAEMKSSGASLDFKVDFYGRGMHHPRALHSEGHQDSMGLCLFLALNKKICRGKVQFVLLDDVVMSIDSDHRRSFCRLINQYFPDIQFLITTHNRTWARQLNSDGVVKKRNMIEFQGWNIDTGPRYGEKAIAWDDVRRCLDNNDCASAAHRLREHLEFVFENASDGLRCMLPYRSDGRYDVGDYVNGVKSGYKSYLKMAKAAAKSWGNTVQVDEFSKLESQFSEIVARTQMEHWNLNENVHYNKWADFTKEDLLPVVESFQDFEDLFRCSQCGGLLSVSFKGVIEKTIKCPCGSINWNLEKNLNC